jgi:hypothetical protein
MEVLEFLLSRVRAELRAGRYQTLGPDFRFTLNTPEGVEPSDAAAGFRRRLEQPEPLTFAGFFGLPREGADRRGLNPLDNQLIKEIKRRPGLLAYASMEPSPAQLRVMPPWANLVLFDRPEDARDWSTGKTHTEAIALSPWVFQALRIHRGLFDPVQGFTPEHLTQLDFTRNASSHPQ